MSHVIIVLFYCELEIEMLINNTSLIQLLLSLLHYFVLYLLLYHCA